MNLKKELVLKHEEEISNLYSYIFENDNSKFDNIKRLFQSEATSISGIFRGIHMTKDRVQSLKISDEINFGYSYSYNREIALEFSSPKFMFSDSYSCLISLNSGYGLDIENLIIKLNEELLKDKHNMDSLTFNTLKFKLAKVQEMNNAEKEFLLTSYSIKINEITIPENNFGIVQIKGDIL